MEKITIKPTAKEIVLKGKAEDGHADVFSYNYEGSAANSLGGLFIVGQVQPATEDTSYMLNLIASLAKREYYSQTDSTIAPKDAFSRTLKKINEVLQDFFRDKDLTANIGIFAVAGENIFISRIGKFKIFLARDNQNIDILNNINLFNKEHIQEKEFSNVISGKIVPKDRIFAFYAGRSITAREKNIKDSFLKMGVDEFSEKLGSIRKANDSFLCAAIHLTIDKYKEPVIKAAPQPKELRKPQLPAEIPISTQPILAKISKDMPIKSPINEPENTWSADVRPPKNESIPKTAVPLQAKEEPKKTEDSNISYIGGGNSPMSEPEQKTASQSPDPSTLIRPTEFSTAKKGGIMDVILKKFKPSGVYVIGVGRGQIFSKKKIVATSSLLAIIIFAIIAKFTFAPYLPIPVPGVSSPEQKAAEKLINEASAGLESAKVKASENNLFEARKILRSYYEALDAETKKKENKQINKIEGEILAKLDELDKAVDLSPSLLKEANEGLDDNFKIWSFVWSVARGEIKIEKPDLAGIGFYPYQDNLYILATDSIYKIVDGLKGKTSSVAWLSKDASLPENPVSLAIDGKIFVVNESGILTVYYKGDRVAEINTSIPVEKGSALLTSPDSPSLYLVDKGLGRIYVITRDAGTLLKTLKLNNEEPILDASMADDGTIYLLSKDNKVWKVTP